MDNHRGAQRHRRQQERSTLILNVDLSEQRLYSYDDLIACGSHAAAKKKV